MMGTARRTQKMRRPAVAALAAAFAAAAGAQDYPVRPIRMVVPAAPGGVTDIAARALAPRLAEALGQTIVVDNRAGAGGLIGTETVARAAPDGHTLLAVFDSFVSNPHVFRDRNVPYDIVRDFAPISLLVRGPQLFVVHPKLGAKSLGEFVALARARRAPVHYATAGPATSSRLSVELFKAVSGLDATLVHYKGGGPALNELLGGHVEAMIASAGLVIPHVRAGRLTAIAVTTPQRSPLVPGVPAVSEYYPGFEAQSWVGMLAPAKTPPAIVRRLHAEIAQALAAPAAQDYFERLGYETVASPPERFASWIRSESEKWGKLVRERNITPE
jgi:tripartite-type tricarboxylate transporter receptor subunit TctC